MKLTLNQKEAIIYSGAITLCAVLIGLFGMLILDILFPIQSTPWNYVNIMGFRVADFIFTFLLICVGISWVIHGVGFVIIRR